MRGKMRQENYRGWARFMLANSLELSGLERDVCVSVCLQTWGPSIGQRRILWKALNRIHPEGCGKWGRPK